MTIKELASIHAATLHDALQRANRVAPTKGAGYDKAQGIHLTFNVDHCEVRATDTEVTFWQSIPATLTDPYADPIEMRLPSQMFVAFIASLPMAGEQVVRFRVDENSPRQMILKYANTKLQAKMNQIVGSYPAFGPRPMDGMIPAQELASRLEQVAWATGDTGVLQGVLIDGDRLVAMDSKRAALVPCPVNVDEPVVAMLASLVPLIKLGTDIRIMVEHGKVYLALDDTCQVSSTTIAQPYPIAGVNRLPELELNEGFTMARQRLIDALQRLLIGVRNDRVPRAALTITKGALDMRLIATGAGEFEDSAAITNDGEEVEELKFLLNPNTLIEALNNVGGGNVIIKYGTNRRPWHLVGSDGYESWVMPIDPNTATED